MNSKEIIDAFYFRHACKIFDKDKKISKEDFDTILEAARLSPSSFGFEPWRFIIVQDMKLREKLLPVTWGAQNILPTASHYVIILARKKPTLLYNSDYITHMMYDIHKLPKEKAEARRLKYKKFQEEDFKLLESDRAIFDWAAKQCYIALANMMSVAAMLKIDSCAVEGFEMEKIEPILRDEFGVDTDIFGVAVMVGFGYRVKPQPPKTRQPLEDIVEWR
ncbi:MAG: NAD(P)H-dependent oxidoreductase [Epsilonproteobacteria bacterium]|nr:NAD(P)H-dependent oxidoreductase [Campylobacterota bacterium]